MGDQLTVHVNADGTHSVSADVDTFETPGSFSVLLRNHGAPTHVHVRIDGDLRGVASLAANNHFLDADADRVVGVTVADSPRPLSGDVTVVTGYGAASASMSVRLRERTELDDGVAVADDLAETPTAVDGPEESLRGPIAVAATGVVAGVLAFLFVDGIAGAFLAAVLLAGGLAVAGFLARYS